MKPRIYRRHPLKYAFGVSIQSNAKKQSCEFWFGHVYLWYASYAYQSDWLYERCNRDCMLKSSAVVDDIKV